MGSTRRWISLTEEPCWKGNPAAAAVFFAALQSQIYQVGVLVLGGLGLLKSRMEWRGEVP